MEISNIFKMAEQAWPREILDELYSIYDRRPGDLTTVDKEAIKQVFDRFPDRSERDRELAHNWAAFNTR